MFAVPRIRTELETHLLIPHESGTEEDEDVQLESMKRAVLQTDAIEGMRIAATELQNNTRVLQNLKEDQMKLESALQRANERVDALSSIINAAQTNNNNTLPPRKSIQWLRLILCFMCSLTVAGVSHGKAGFVELLVAYGVSGSMCELGESRCTRQFDDVSSSFNTGLITSTLAIVVVGWLYDRFGARSVSACGTVLIAFGFLLLEIPLLGVAYGYDVWTSPLLPLIILVVDIGSLGSAAALLGMIYQIPGWQAFVVGLWASTFTIATAIPNAISFIMDRTGWTLASVVGIYAFVVALAAVVFKSIVPSQDEYYAAGKECLGVPWPNRKISSLRLQVKRSLAVLLSHQMDHSWLAVCIAICYACRDFEEQILSMLAFSTDSLDKDLGNITQLLAGISGAFLVVAMTFATRACMKEGSQNTTVKLLWLSLTVSMMGAVAFVSHRTPLQQFPYAASSVTTCCLHAIQMIHCITYSLPEQVGMFAGILSSIILFVYVIALTTCNIISQVLSSISLLTLLSVLYGLVAGLAAANFCCAKSRKLPEVPVLLPEDEQILSEPFGCKTFDEILLTIHMDVKDKKTLFKILCQPEEQLQPLRDEFALRRGEGTFIDSITSFFQI